MPDNDNVTPEELAAIRLFHDRRKQNLPLTYNEKDKYVRLEDGSIIAYIYAAHSFGYRFVSNENDIDRLLAEVERLTAENARMVILARDLCRQLDDEGCMPDDCKQFEPVHADADAHRAQPGRGE